MNTNSNNITDHLDAAVSTCMNLADAPLQRLQCAMRLLDTPIMRRWLHGLIEEGGEDAEAARQLLRHLSWGIPLTAPEELRKISRMLRAVFRSAIERARERKIEMVLND